MSTDEIEMSRMSEALEEIDERTPFNTRITKRNVSNEDDQTPNTIGSSLYRTETLILLILVATISAAAMFAPPGGYFASSGPATNGSYFHAEYKTWPELISGCQNQSTLGVAVGLCFKLYRVHSMLLLLSFMIASLGVLFIFVLNIAKGRNADFFGRLSLFVSFNLLAYSIFLLPLVQMGYLERGLEGLNFMIYFFIMVWTMINFYLGVSLLAEFQGFGWVRNDRGILAGNDLEAQP